jgi:hypothetical protein
MKKASKAVLVLAAIGMVSALLLVPAVQIPVVPVCSISQDSKCPLFDNYIYGSGSVAYAYFGIGAIQVPNLYGAGRGYCLIYGHPAITCGLQERTA